MEAHRFTSNQGHTLELDICFACQGLWFDRHENLKLSPASVVELFRLLHEHRTDQHQPLAESMACPRCNTSLTKGFDVVRSGRYMIYRCGRQHGRFSSFSSFMIEKGFVRQLTRPEIADIASKVGVINCSNCGAPVDLRREDACSHCRSALSLLDPAAVEKALQSYARPAPPVPTTAVADAMVAMARERSRAERMDAWPSDARLTGAGLAVDLFAVGLSLVSRLWDD